MEAQFHAPCRKCASCRQFRQMHWRERIISEYDRAAYTYFVTLTFSEPHLAGVIAEAVARSKYEGDRAIEQVAWNRHVSLWLKRLRKGRSAAQIARAPTGSLAAKRRAFKPVELRYFGIAELGDERGRLHFHMALHLGQWVPPEVITTEWRSRADAQLVKSREGFAAYVSKYITKTLAIGRVRASKRYGDVQHDADPELKRGQNAAPASTQSRPTALAVESAEGADGDLA